MVLLSRNRQWVRQEYFSSFLVFLLDCGGGGAEEGEGLNCSSILLFTFSCAKFSGSNVLIP